jgi:effector-binding domain-containing protein
MSYQVTTEIVAPQLFAAVRRKVAIRDISKTWKPALDQVWDFLVRNEKLRAGGGHNIFLYHHPARREDAMDIDFGVQVPHAFTGEGEVRLAETPAGEVATTLHVGAYEKMSDAHNAIHAWCFANGRAIGGASWEIYGDWVEDTSKLETRIFYLLG